MYSKKTLSLQAALPLLRLALLFDISSFVRSTFIAPVANVSSLPTCSVDSSLWGSLSARTLLLEVFQLDRTFFIFILYSSLSMLAIISQYSFDFFLSFYELNSILCLLVLVLKFSIFYFYFYYPSLSL